MYFAYVSTAPFCATPIRNIDRGMGAIRIFLQCTGLLFFSPLSHLWFVLDSRPVFFATADGTHT